MRKIILAITLLGVGILQAGCTPQADPPKITSLLLTRTDAAVSAGVSYVLTCNGLNGTSGSFQEIYPDAGEEACKALLALDSKQWDPVASDAICTQESGEGSVSVRGQVLGKAIQAKFSQKNGCEIERWESLSSLLDPLYQDLGEQTL